MSYTKFAVGRLVTFTDRTLLVVAIARLDREEPTVLLDMSEGQTLKNSSVGSGNQLDVEVETGKVKFMFLALLNSR